MPRFKPKGMLDRNAEADLWRHTLSRIPTIYGRLTYLASLRDPNSGIYRHHGLSAAFGREESSKALRDSHRQTFAEWLKLSLSEKNADLTAHLATLEDPRRIVLDHWLESRVYLGQVPGSARRMERELFFRDLEALLAVLRNACADEERAPSSSPPASPGQ
jgi:hypothetical protein